jgi:hypothetical protein
MWRFLLSSSSTQGVNVNDARETIRSFLERFDIPPPRATYDEELDRLTREDLTRRGCPLTGPHGVVRYIPTPVQLAGYAYGHTSRDTQTFVSVYTILLIYLDETFSQDSSGLDDFNTRFALGQKQRNPTLQCLAELIHEIPQRYNLIASNIIVTSTLNFATALLVEQKTKAMPVSALRIVASFHWTHGTACIIADGDTD